MSFVKFLNALGRARGAFIAIFALSCRSSLSEGCSGRARTTAPCLSPPFQGLRARCQAKNMTLRLRERSHAADRHHTRRTRPHETMAVPCEMCGPRAAPLPRPAKKRLEMAVTRVLKSMPANPSVVRADASASVFVFFFRARRVKAARRQRQRRLGVTPTIALC